MDKSSLPEVQIPVQGQRSDASNLPADQVDVTSIPQVDVSRPPPVVQPPVSVMPTTVSMDQVHSVPPVLDMSSQGQYVRPKRLTRAPQRLVVGDPMDPRFNRTMQ